MTTNMFADEWPLTPLETFRREMRFNPWHFYGLQDADDLRVTSSCDPVTKEYAWQSGDAAGRQDLREALARAELILARQLRYDIAPRYRTDTLPWPRLADRRMMRYGPWDADGRWLSIKLPVGYVQAAGIEAHTAVSLGETVTLSDADHDGYYELATIGPFATTETNEAEIGVYFVPGDRIGADPALSERWRIQPVNVTISGGQLTITGSSWLFVRPELYETVQATDLVAGDLTNFAGSVDVYRRFTDPTGQTGTTSQGVIIWETRPCHGWWCSCTVCSSVLSAYQGSPTDPAAIGQAVARVGIRDGIKGEITPAEALYDATTGLWSAVCPNCAWPPCEEPDRVVVRTLAGYPLTAQGQVDPKWRRIVTWLAAAELGNGLSGCKDANRQLYYWQQDLAKVGNDKELYATSQAVLGNPFGTRRGHVHAWQYISSGEIQARPILI